MARKTARIEVFRVGTFSPMEGGAITFSAADLKAMADAYNRDTAPAPVVVGHPTTDAPAYAWADAFDFDPQQGVMSAEIGDIDPAFAEMVRSGRYKKVSLALHAPQSSANPTPGAWYPKHIGFLGGAAPAVAGLKNVSFAAGGEVATFTASFGSQVAEETSSILRTLREFFIEKFGMEAADKALPPWRIEWLNAMEPEKAPGAAFAEATQISPPNPLPKKEATVPDPNAPKPSDPAFAARDADLTAREAALLAREAEVAHSANASFAAALVAEGRLLPVLEAKVVAIFDSLPSHASVSFSEGGEKITAGAALREVLQALPKVVSFGALELGAEPGTEKTASFAADGKEVDAAGLVLHGKALAYQRAHPGTSFMDAVQAVS